MALSTSDPYYRAEETPPAIVTLIHGLHAVWPGAEIGTKGNTVHVRGYHRSRNWVLHSPDCTNRTYSVTETIGNRSGGDGDWVCAVDLGGLAKATLLEVCRRLDAAVRAGRLEKITEWYGNLDGDTHVDGYNNIRNALASSDDSHLTHLHMSFDRGRANEDHSDLLAILTEEDDMTPAELLGTMLGKTGPTVGVALQDGYNNAKAALDLATANAAAVSDLGAKVAAIQTGGVDLDALAVKVADLLAARLKD